MYNPPESGVDSLEFIEIYNAGTSAVNLRNHSILYGGSKRFTFNTDTNLVTNRTLVIAVSNPNAVRRQYNLNYTPIQVTSVSGLSNTGTTVKILGPADETLDSVTYASSWNAATVGLGASLILCDPSSDNALAANWSASTLGTGNIINNNELKASPGALEACSGTLSVQWLKISATIINAYETSITWQVQEFDVSNYVLEQSVDGINFNTTATISAKGSGNQIYTHIVKNIGNSFYRLKQVDVNGKFSYSRVVVVTTNTKTRVTITPNPVRDIVLVTINPTLIQTDFSLINSQGIILQTIKPTSTNFQINIAHYPNGMYYLRNANTNTVSIIKQ